MGDPITISKTLSIRDCGYDEDWLQEQIASAPSIIGLGDLVLVEREKRQLSGGKLDILLKSRDGETVFEIEVMLGETDGDHISRTIEYWDLEQRNDSQRKHFPVLIAEEITRRFFNLIYRLSLSIPIIAIKVNIAEIERKKALHFTTILNAFEDSEFESRRRSETKSNDAADEKYWQKKASWTLTHAQTILKIVSPVIDRIEVRFCDDAIRLLRDGEVYFKFTKNRENQKTSFYTWLKNEVMPPTKAMLDKNRISYNLKPYGTKAQTLRVELDQNLIQGKTDVFQKVAGFVKESWLN